MVMIAGFEPFRGSLAQRFWILTWVKANATRYLWEEVGVHRSYPSRSEGVLVELSVGKQTSAF